MIRLFIVAIGGLCLFGVSPASAGEVINVVVNTVHVLHLQRDANVVMVATPAIANVSVESPRLIFIFGIEPGETNLYVLDSGGNVIIESALVVTPDDDRHVTVNRPDDESTLSCAPRCAAVGTQVGSSSPAASSGGGSEATATADAGVATAADDGATADAGVATAADDGATADAGVATAADDGATADAGVATVADDGATADAGVATVADDGATADAGVATVADDGGGATAISSDRVGALPPLP